MNIERSKFLLLVGAISAAAGVASASASCTTTTNSTNDGGAGPAPSSSTGTSGGPSTDDGGGGTGDAGNDAGACLGDEFDAGVSEGGDAGDAGDLGLGPCGALTAPGCSSACDTVFANFKSGIAADIRSCLSSLPTCEGGADDIPTCIEASAAKACADTSATTTCTPLVGNCSGGVDAGDAGDAGTFDQATCEAIVKALSTDGRAQFVSCITEGVTSSPNCTADPMSCVNQMKQRF